MLHIVVQTFSEIPPALPFAMKGDHIFNFKESLTQEAAAKAYKVCAKSITELRDIVINDISNDTGVESALVLCVDEMGQKTVAAYSPNHYHQEVVNLLWPDIPTQEDIRNASVNTDVGVYQVA